MLKAEIQKGKNPVVSSAGDIPEQLNDIAILINQIYNQLRSAAPASAFLFRTGLTNMINDPNSEVWGIIGNQTGIVWKKQEEESDE